MFMKEQVTDILKVLQDMTAEMRLMSETINLQYAEIAKLNRNIEALNRQIRKKDETIAKLTERLSKYENLKKNSGNSQHSTEQGDMKDRNSPKDEDSQGKPSGKKPGGQEGHDGHKLYCSYTPDEIVNDAPSYCTNCGEVSCGCRACA